MKKFAFLLARVGAPITAGCLVIFLILLLLSGCARTLPTPAEIAAQQAADQAHHDAQASIDYGRLQQWLATCQNSSFDHYFYTSPQNSNTPDGVTMVCKDGTKATFH